MARCPKCFGHFSQLAAWEKVCKTCFAKNKQEELEDAKYRILTLEASNRRLQSQLNAQTAPGIDAAFLKAIEAIVPPG